MFCTQCGAEIEVGAEARFCPTCGAELLLPAAGEPRQPEATADQAAIPLPARGAAAGAPAVQVRVVQAFWLRRVALLLLAAFWVCLAGAGLAPLLALLSAASHSVSDPIDRPTLLVLALMLLVAAALALGAMVAAVRIGSRKVTVAPLLPAARQDYLAADRGLYVASFNLPYHRRFYIFHPWDSLSPYAVDERHEVLALKHGRSVLKLAAYGYFLELREAVLPRLPSREWELAKAPGYRWGFLGVGLVVLVVAGAALGTYFEDLSRGPVPDSRCDVCGAPVYLTVSEGPNEATLRPTHEYCPPHAYIYSVLNPKVTVESLDRARREGDAEQTVGFSLLLLAGAVVWGALATAVALFARSPYGRLRRLEL